ncbi:MAG: hypothetical protein O2855_09320, partial [Planctomycetota bacterium]|nr:hypothetical protein [Planctomycetota bacterium]
MVANPDPPDPDDQFDARDRSDSHDPDSLPLGSIIWRFRRLLVAGARSGTLVGLAYLSLRPATTSYEFLVDTPTTVTAGQLAASEVLGTAGSAQVSAKAADRNGRLVRVTLLFP